MCNRQHHDSYVIKESGIGWKIFSYRLVDGKPRKKQDGRIALSPLVSNQYYHTWDGNVKWWKECGQGDGFCFFLSKSQAKTAKKSWGGASGPDYKIVLLAIRYSDGIGAHIEKGFIEGPIEIALCKTFKLFRSKKYTLVQGEII